MNIIMHGSKIGLHVLGNGSAGVAAIEKSKQLGFVWPVHKNVHIESIPVTVKALTPQTITVTRIKTEWDDPSHILGKGAAVYRSEARKLLDFVRHEIPVDAEWNAADYKEVLNESDPPGPQGYRELALFCIELCNEATARGIRLAIPALNAGTPEWDEMIAMVETGLFGVMKRGGHILTTHDGLLPHDSMLPPWASVIGIDPDAEPIPGAPIVLGAGSMNLRYRYLYHLLRARGEVVPLVISEYYAGGTYDEANIGTVLRNLFWYDSEIRRDYYVLGVTPFTFDPDGGWLNQNYNFILPALYDYMVSQRGIPNAGLPSPVPTVRTNQMFINAINRARKTLGIASNRWWDEIVVKGGMAEILGPLAGRDLPYNGPFNLSAKIIAAIKSEWPDV